MIRIVMLAQIYKKRKFHMVTFQPLIHGRFKYNKDCCSYTCVLFKYECVYTGYLEQSLYNNVHDLCGSTAVSILVIKSENNVYMSVAQYIHTWWVARGCSRIYNVTQLYVYHFSWTCCVLVIFIFGPEERCSWLALSRLIFTSKPSNENSHGNTWKLHVYITICIIFQLNVKYYHIYSVTAFQ